MTFSHSFRVLFYFVAIVLCMSACYIYAQDLPAQPSTALPSIDAAAEVTAPCAADSTAHLLLWTGPQHSSFLAPISEQHLSVQGVKPQDAPVVSPDVLAQVEAHPHHRFFHRTSHLNAIVKPAQPMNESAILELLSKTSSTTAAAR